MEAVQPLLLSGIRGPGLTAVQQGADDTCLVDLEFCGHSLAITAAAFARWVLSFALSDRSLEIVEPRYVKVLTQSRVLLLMEI